MGANAQTSVPVFTAGQVLTAQQQTEINTGIPVFATSTTRDAAFGGTGEKTLAEGQFAYLEDSNTTQYYDGAAWQSVSAGGLTLISTTTFSGSTITLSSIPQTYKNLYLVVRNFLPGTDNEGYWLRINSDSTANRHRSTLLTNATGLTFDSTAWTSFNGFDNAVTQHLAIINIYDYTNSATWKIGNWIQVGNNETTTTSADFAAGWGWYNQIDAITSLQFIATGGTFTSGTVLLYGVA